VAGSEFAFVLAVSCSSYAIESIASSCFSRRARPRAAMRVGLEQLLIEDADDFVSPPAPACWPLAGEPDVGAFSFLLRALSLRRRAEPVSGLA
jgi:hypothetical protein